jgi:hypothetical protein
VTLPCEATPSSHYTIISGYGTTREYHQHRQYYEVLTALLSSSRTPRTFDCLLSLPLFDFRIGITGRKKKKPEAATGRRWFKVRLDRRITVERSSMALQSISIDKCKVIIIDRKDSKRDGKRVLGVCKTNEKQKESRAIC